MQRGEIRLVDLEPVRGAEANKQRPAIIVSNDGANITAQRLGHGVVTVVPVTSNTNRVYRARDARVGATAMGMRHPQDGWATRQSRVLRCCASPTVSIG